MEKKSYMIVRIEKPLASNAKISGKIVSIKEWVKTKNQEEKDPIYTHPVHLSQIFDYDGFIKVYCRSHKEFIETIKKYMEKENA